MKHIRPVASALAVALLAVLPGTAAHAQSIPNVLGVGNQYGHVDFDDGSQCHMDYSITESPYPQTSTDLHTITALQATANMWCDTPRSECYLNVTLDGITHNVNCWNSSPPYPSSWTASVTVSPVSYGWHTATFDGWGGSAINPDGTGSLTTFVAPPAP